MIIEKDKVAVVLDIMFYSWLIFIQGNNYE